MPSHFILPLVHCNYSKSRLVQKIIFNNFLDKKKPDFHTKTVDISKTFKQVVNEYAVLEVSMEINAQ